MSLARVLERDKLTQPQRNLASYVFGRLGIESERRLVAFLNHGIPFEESYSGEKQTIQEWAKGFGTDVRF